MKSFVVDASVGAKWFFQEEFQEQAIDLFQRAKRKEIKLIVPELFYIEMGNVCWQRVQRRLIKESEAITILDELNDFPFEKYPDQELAEVALENAVRFDITVYDGLYIALAETYVVPLITADLQILKALGGRFDFILSIKELKD